MTIIAGMILLCSVKIGSPGTYGAFVKNVPTTVKYLTEDKQALVQFDFRGVEALRVLDEGPWYELHDVANLTSETYMNCKEKKNGK